MSIFDLLRQEFVQNAFLAGTIIALVSGIVGYFIILRGQAFATETLSHVGFAGAAGAALIGLNSLVGMFVLTVLTATGMGALGKTVEGAGCRGGHGAFVHAWPGRFVSKPVYAKREPRRKPSLWFDSERNPRRCAAYTWVQVRLS